MSVANGGGGLNTLDFVEQRGGKRERVKWKKGVCHQTISHWNYEDQ